MVCRDVVSCIAEDPAGIEFRPGLALEPAAVRKHDIRHRQFVQGQRAGLVGRDHRAGAERFNGGHAAHDHVLPRHAAHADGQGD